jgi:choline dehydrogenase-like flavoprotein
LNLKLSLKTLAGNSMMSEQLQIAIVGGGIGGLTAALALRARGLNVTVFEQAGEQREIGAGISIFPNAALLLQRIGLTDRIKTTGAPNTSLVLRTSLGQLIDSVARPSSGVQGYNRMKRLLPELARSQSGDARLGTSAIEVTRDVPFTEPDRLRATRRGSRGVLIQSLSSSEDVVGAVEQPAMRETAPTFCRGCE